MDHPAVEGAMNVAVLGASRNPERYSYAAVKVLLEAGHAVFPVHPTFRSIDGIPAFRTLQDLPEAPHSVTVYLAPERSAPLERDFLAVRPKRVIFNPGAENSHLARVLRESGVVTLDACTLVLLRTGQFDRAGFKGGGP